MLERIVTNVSSPKLYFDACCFIDLAQKAVTGAVADDREDHVWYCQKFLEAHKGGEAMIYTSTLSVAECTHFKDENKNIVLTAEVKALFRAFLMSGKAVIPVQPTPRILDGARDIHWDHGLNLGAADRVHLITALRMGCDAFITTDNPIIKKKTELAALGILVCTGADAKEYLPDKYKQLDLKIPQKTASTQPTA